MQALNMSDYLTDFAMATGVGLTFLLLSWATSRTIFLGRPLPLHMKIGLRYTFLFILGMAYIMMVVSWLSGPPGVMFLFLGIWGGLVAYLAWRSYRRARTVERQRTGGTE